MPGDRIRLTVHFANVIYFEDRRGERNWNRPCESIIRKSKKSGITDFLSMNSWRVGSGGCPVGGVAEDARACVALCVALWHCVAHCVAPTAICGACGCRVARAPTKEGRPNMAPHSTHVANPHI